MWYNLDHTFMESTFGQFVKRRRLEKEIGLREFAELVGVEASNYSKIERGLKRAPTKDRLLPYLRALEIAPQSKEHQNLEILAEVANGEIPGKVLSDKDLVAKLPILFNGMANGSFTDEQLDELLETIRHAHQPEVEPEVA